MSNQLEHLYVQLVFDGERPSDSWLRHRLNVGPPGDFLRESEGGPITWDDLSAEHIIRHACVWRSRDRYVPNDRFARRVSQAFDGLVLLFQRQREYLAKPDICPTCRRPKEYNLSEYRWCAECERAVVVGKHRCSYKKAG